MVKINDKIICSEQSAFVSGRQVLDGPLILNETIGWYKVVTEKACDSVRWDFLDYMSDLLGFGTRWQAWINMCLGSSRTSILLNGSPTKEFKVKRGLRQGDPLSPFFISRSDGRTGN
ncbi:uncharacterized protein [Rutidosis leptorrhynchoides]|uniref:uncharacterized protein n=1 Tax=Rutidosis leptorrhynchoides TaxID=125765 RepID=UPI003A990B06